MVKFNLSCQIVIGCEQKLFVKRDKKEVGAVERIRW